MKDKKKTVTKQCDSTTDGLGSIPITMAEINVRLNDFEKNPGKCCQEWKHSPIDTARRGAGLDVMEARLTLEIHKLGEKPGQQSAKAAGLKMDLAAVKVRRRIGLLFDMLAKADIGRSDDAEMIESSAAEIKGMKAQAATLQTRLDQLRARDARAELANAHLIQDELRWTQEVFLDGRFRRTASEETHAILQYTLESMTANGRYSGECTYDGLDQRITELRQQIEHLEEREKTELTDKEIREMENLEKQLTNLNGAIEDACKMHAAQAAKGEVVKRLIGEMFEIARIDAAGLAEVHEITCEMIKQTVPA